MVDRSGHPGTPAWVPGPGDTPGDRDPVHGDRLYRRRGRVRRPVRQIHARRHDGDVRDGALPWPDTWAAAVWATRAGLRLRHGLHGLCRSRGCARSGDGRISGRALATTLRGPYASGFAWDLRNSASTL